MAAPTKPQKVTSYGNTSIWLVPTIADPTAPTAIEINAGDYLSCYALSDQEGPTSTHEKVSLPVLLCETDVEQGFGQTTHEHPDLVFVYEPQAAAASAGKTAWDLVQPGFDGFIVWRYGIDADTDDQVTVGEFVTVVPAEVKLASEGRTSNDATGISTFMGTAIVKSPYPQYNVAVA